MEGMMAVKVHILATFVAAGQEEFVNLEKEKWEKAQYVSSHETIGGNYIIKAKGPDIEAALKALGSTRWESTWHKNAKVCGWTRKGLGEARALFRALVQFDKLDVVLIHVQFDA